MVPLYHYATADFLLTNTFVSISIFFAFSFEQKKRN